MESEVHQKYRFILEAWAAETGERRGDGLYLRVAGEHAALANRFAFGGGSYVGPGVNTTDARLLEAADALRTLRETGEPVLLAYPASAVHAYIYDRVMAGFVEDGRSFFFDWKVGAKEGEHEYATVDTRGNGEETEPGRVNVHMGDNNYLLRVDHVGTPKEVNDRITDIPADHWEQL